MKNTLIKYVALGAIIGSSAVHAGYDISGQGTSIILADGNTTEIVVAKVTPKVSGTFTPTAIGLAAASGASTDANINDVAPDFIVSSLAMRLGISNNMAIAVIQDTPYGADVSWTAGIMNGVTGKINSSATTLLVSRSFGDKEMISKEMMSKEMMSKEMMSKEMMSKEMMYKDKDMMSEHKEMMSKDKEMMSKDKEMMSKDKEMMSKEMMSKHKEMMSKHKEMMSKHKEKMSKDKKMMSKEMMSKDKEMMSKKMMSKDKGMMSKIMSAKSVVTIYGGVKNQSLDVTATVPPALSYALDAGKSSSIGYVMGAAYEKPEIALKVSLTYHNKIKHDFTITESWVHPLAGNQQNNSSMTVYTPTAVNLDFQTGINTKTLLFGTIRHARWSELEATPAIYEAITGNSLLEKGTDTTTYTIGLGRQLTDAWSIAATYGKEKAFKTPGSPLSVTDGHSSIGLGATYNVDKVKVTVGVKRTKLGDTDVYTTHPVTGAPFVAAEMRDNTSIASAIKVAYKF